MSFGYMILCSGASVAVVKAALVPQHDLSSDRTARDRRALVSRVELQLDGYIATLPEWRGTDGLFTFISFCYTILCFESSSGIMKAALMHEDDLPSHRTARDRRASERLVMSS